VVKRVDVAHLPEHANDLLEGETRPRHLQVQLQTVLGAQHELTNERTGDDRETVCAAFPHSRGAVYQAT